MIFSLKNAIAVAALESLYAKAITRAERAEQRISELLAHNSDLVNENRALKQQLEVNRQFEMDRSFGTLLGRPEPAKLPLANGNSIEVKPMYSPGYKEPVGFRPFGKRGLTGAI